MSKPSAEPGEGPDEGPTESRPVYGLRPFGNYVLVRKLAVGGMAEIFLAKQLGVEGFERNVVIKQMLPHLARQPEFVDMFLDEARLAARLVHPNIIPIYDLGSVDGTYYICMEYLPGEDLSWILRRARVRDLTMPVDVALRITIDAAHGLHFAHELADQEGKPLHIVHRDVSPGNILVGYEGEVKVLDFGIAKAESRVTSTEVGTVKGKALYMSPEQGRADPIDRRADVYSLGVTLYEILTSVRPFARDSTQGVVEAVTQGAFEPLRRRRPELPEELERIVHKAMARDVAARYGSCGELAADLERLLESATPSGAGAVSRFVRELFGTDEVSQKTKIPTLASLERAQLLEQGPPGPEKSTPGTQRSQQQRRRARRLASISIAALLAVTTLGGLLLWKTRSPEGCAVRYGSKASDAIVIGATLPLTIGRLPDDGERQLLNAMLLALDEINQRDGVGGRPFALLTCDSSGDPALTKRQAAWLADEIKVPVVFTSWSSLTLAAANVTVPRHVLTVTGDSTSPELTAVPANVDGVRLLWQTAPSDVRMGRVLAQLLARDPAFAGLQRIGVLYQNDPYGQGLAGVVASQLARLAPATAVVSIQYPVFGDVTKQVKQLAEASPQLTLVIGWSNDVRRILELAAKRPALTRAAGHRWFFSDSVKESILFEGLAYPSEIDGAFGLGAADGGGDEAASFAARYLAEFGRNALDQTYAANSYDAMYLVALAAAYALGSDGKGALTGLRLAEGLTHLSSGSHFGLVPEQFTAARATLQSGGSIDVTGASGQLDFDNQTGEAPAAFQVWRIRDKAFIKERRIAWQSTP